MTYRTCEIARALGVSPRKITSAVDRGLLPGDRDPGTGNRRTFSRDAVYQFALMERLAELGIGTSRASVIAGKHTNANGVLVVTGTDAQVYAPDRIKVPPAALILNLDTLRADVDNRLTHG